jgi:hypothetical protein
MLIIQHRVNTVEQLAATPFQLGVELDIRYYKDELAIHHDPFVPGQDWNTYLATYNHAFMIANIKSEGVEERVIAALQQRGIQDYFLLDMSLPFMVKYVRKGFRNMAVRFSEYEPLEQARRFEGLAQWVWADCFEPVVMNPEVYAYLSRHFKICIVSPELQGHDAAVLQQFITHYRQWPVDAVCTKRPDLWGGD